MFARTLFATALLVAPLVTMPVDGSAQARATGAGSASAASAPMPASAQRPMDMPAGIRKAFDGRTPPPGIRRVFPQQPPAPAPDPEPLPEPEPEEECAVEIVFLGGQFVLVDCNGNLVDPV